MTLKNNKPTLKLNHQYYIEYQGIMAITEPKTIDFVISTQKCLYAQTVSFDEDKWEKQYLQELNFLYFEHLKIKIFKEK